MRSVAEVRTIPPEEVGSNGKALAVRFCPVSDEPEMVTVQMTAHKTEYEQDCLLSSELILILFREKMTVFEMHARVETEANLRGINRVAWIDDQYTEIA
jgi:hypothetical protein